MALGQPPNENMVGRWGTWRRGACVDDSFNPEHRGYGYRLYDSVLHGLPLFVETGTWSDLTQTLTPTLTPIPTLTPTPTPTPTPTLTRRCRSGRVSTATAEPAAAAAAEPPWAATAARLVLHTLTLT